MANDKGEIVGIDLGTTFSAVAYLDRMGFPVTIPNAEGELITPSAVLFEPDGSVVVGRQALRAAIVQPERVALCVKRDMGETFYSRIVAGRRWKPQHLAAFILRKLKQDAERRIGPVRGAVITVPAYYDEARRQATVDAGRIASLRVVDIINEPTAAALAYAFRKVVDRGDLDAIEQLKSAGGTVAVYDLGGGTFDVTVIRQCENQVNVLATDGDLFLGGRDWDERIVNHVAKAFIETFGTDPRENPQAMQELWRAAEEAKKDLSSRQATMFSISHAGHRLPVTLTRDQFGQMTKDLLYRTESRIVRVLRNAHLSWSDLNEVLLVGGSSRHAAGPRDDRHPQRQAAQRLAGVRRDRRARRGRPRRGAPGPGKDRSRTGILRSRARANSHVHAGRRGGPVRAPLRHPLLHRRRPPPPRPLCREPARPHPLWWASRPTPRRRPPNRPPPRRRSQAEMRQRLRSLRNRPPLRPSHRPSRNCPPRPCRPARPGQTRGASAADATPAAADRGSGFLQRGKRQRAQPGRGRLLR